MTNLQLNGYSFTQEPSDNFLNIFHGIKEARKWPLAIPANAAFCRVKSTKKIQVFSSIGMNRTWKQTTCLSKEMNQSSLKKKIPKR